MATSSVPKGTEDITSYGADTNTLVFEKGSQKVSSGLSKTGVSLEDLFVQSAFNGTIGGGTAGPLICDVDNSSTSKIKYDASGGAFYYQAGGGNALCRRLVHLSPGRFYFMTGGTMTDWEQVNGSGDIAAAVVVTNIFLEGGELIQKYNATANTNWEIHDGKFTTARGFSGTGVVSGGSVLVTREDSAGTIPTGASLRVNGTGRVKWNGGDITSLYVYGDGGIDFWDIPANATITNLYISKRGKANSRLQGRDFTLTITNKRVYGDRTDTVP